MPLNIRAARRHWRSLVKLILFILLIVAANYASDWAIDALKFELRPSNEDAVHQVIMTSALVYAVLIAIPFVPGVEIGLTLIGMIGQEIVLLVYLSTLVGLSISFVIGRFISLEGLIRLLEGFDFARAAQLLRIIEPMNGEERLRFLVSKAPTRFLPFLLRHRYIALAVAINLPGNIIIGGGGGLALMAGVSRLYSPPAYLATIAIAVSPLPLAILFFGSQILPD